MSLDELEFRDFEGGGLMIADHTGPFCWLNMLEPTPQEKVELKRERELFEFKVGCGCIGCFVVTFLFLVGLILLGIFIGKGL